MLTPETQPDHYTEPPYTSMPVLFWPKGVVDKEKGNPMVGFVIKGWDLGMADIDVLPEGDGAVMTFDGAFHIGDRRIFDPRGLVSSAAARKGVWEPAPYIQPFIEKRIKEMGLASKKQATKAE